MAQTMCNHVWSGSLKGTVCALCDKVRDNTTDATGMLPRGDNVIVRVVQHGAHKGLAMPDKAQEGKEYVVVGMGPKVEELEIGDKVLMAGTQGVDWDYLPGCKDLLALKQGNVLIRMGKTGVPRA